LRRSGADGPFGALHLNEKPAALSTVS